MSFPCSDSCFAQFRLLVFIAIYFITFAFWHLSSSFLFFGDSLHFQNAFCIQTMYGIPASPLAHSPSSKDPFFLLSLAAHLFLVFFSSSFLISPSFSGWSICEIDNGGGSHPAWSWCVMLMGRLLECSLRTVLSFIALFCVPALSHLLDNMCLSLGKGVGRKGSTLGSFLMVQSVLFGYHFKKGGEEWNNFCDVCVFDFPAHSCWGAPTDNSTISIYHETIRGGRCVSTVDLFLMSYELTGCMKSV